MQQSIKKLAVLLLFITTITSCNQGPTLQTYYVDHQEKSSFTSFDLPASLINVDHIEMTEAQTEAYESVRKLNILAYKTENTDADAYKLELAEVKTILTNPKYEELARGGNVKEGRFVVKFLGDVDSIDELIIFVNAKNKGFLIARVLGDDMNAGKLLKLESVLKDIKFEDGQLEQFQSLIK